MSEGGSYADRLAERVDGTGRKVALVAARFHEGVTGVLLERARATLLEHGVAEGDVDVVRVPGAWELPQAVQRLAEDGRVHAVIALGCLIRGETAHFDVIAHEVARGLGDAAARHGVPVILGVLTTETEPQAVERADPDGQDKGREAALAALEMIGVYERIDAARTGVRGFR